MAKCYCIYCKIEVNRLSNFMCPNCMKLIFKDDTEFQKYNNRREKIKNKSSSTTEYNIEKKSTVDNFIQVDTPESTVTISETPLSDCIEENSVNDWADGTNDVIKEHTTVKNTSEHNSASIDIIKYEKAGNDIKESNGSNVQQKQLNFRNKRNEEKRIFIDGMDLNYDGYYDDTIFIYPEFKDTFFIETLKKFLIGTIFFLLLLVFFVWYWIS